VNMEYLSWRRFTVSESFIVMCAFITSTTSVDILFSLLFVFAARSELRKVLLLAPSVWAFLFVYEISQEPLNGFAPNSHGRRV